MVVVEKKQAKVNLSTYTQTLNGAGLESIFLQNWG